MEAITFGHVEAVALLLKNDRVDVSICPTEFMNYTGRMSLEILQLLCNDPRIGVTSLRDTNVVEALHPPNWPVVEFLMTLPHLDLSVHHNRLFLEACSDGKLSIVKKLLSDARVNPFDVNNRAFLEACKMGHVEVVSVLLELKLMDSDEDFLQELFEASSVDALRLLLQHKSVNVPLHIIDLSFEQSCANHNTAFTKLLLLHHNLRIPTSFDFKSAMGHASMSSLLQDELVAAEERCDILTMRSVLCWSIQSGTRPATTRWTVSSSNF
ncbi:hypothetical protein HDU98_009445 [Podochytrium sp. JEL0797]|nr:hypothetical protein HDU98_009445 [Podochytrium sp. JEL0797]